METDPLEETLQQASALADDDEWEAAYELLLGELENHPQHVMLLCMLGTTARAMGIDGEASEFFRRCLAEQPTDPVVLATAGAGLAALAEPEAESALRLAALTAPDVPYTRLQYGAFLAREGLADAAIDELEAARALDGDDPLIRTELATAYLLANRKDAGRAELEEAVARDPDDAWVRSLYALALADVGELELAAEEASEAARARPDDADLQVFAALASASQGWLDEAWRALAAAEQAAASPGLLAEAEERIEAGADAAAQLLRADLVPALLRPRLLERP